MAFWKHIIADSGGSNTTWAFCSNDGTVRLLETESLHPKFILQWDAAAWEKLRSRLGDLSDETLFFYGSGCAQAETQEALSAQFRTIGFGVVSVFPDTLGACRATAGRNPGTVAILGTGSVLVEYDGEQITRRIGGYGGILGDEGSGFHFAKLVLHDYLDGVLPAALQTGVEEVAGARADVFRKLASPEAQQWIAALGGKLAHLPLESHHERALEAFLSLYLPQVEGSGRTMDVVGSYGFFQRALLDRLLPQKGWKPGRISRNPIEQLVEFHG